MNNQQLTYPRFWQTIGWLLVAAIVLFSIVPKPPQPPLITSDKSHHLLAYAGTMFWFQLAFNARFRWIIFLVGLGIALEIIQGLLSYRYFEYADILANISGVVIGLILANTPIGQLMPYLDNVLNNVLSTRRDSF